MARPALGRGLGALLGGQPSADKAGQTPAGSPSSSAIPSEDSRDQVQSIPVGQITPSTLQPRKDFPEESLRELADSIREQGIVQPLIVRRCGDRLELIAGERRWRAAQLVGLPEVPAIIREADDTTVLELMLIENLQREDLNPVEEAQGYAQLIAQFDLRQEDVALKVGKSRVAVANALRLLKLPPSVQEWLRQEKLAVGHAKVLLGLENPEEQQEAAQQVMHRQLSVRQTEELVAKWRTPSVSAAAPTPVPVPRDPHVIDIENRLHERLGTKVTLRYREGRGSLEIRFYSDDDLNRILQLIGLDLA